MKPHLFFIKITTNFNIYYYSMRYDLEKVQSTTNKNIITIIKNILNNDKFISKEINNMEFHIKEIKLSDNEQFLISDIRKYLSNFIHYDKKIKEWVISYNTKPDYNIFNLINDKINLKLMLVGSYFDNIIKNENDREKLFDLFENYYHIRPSDALIYKIQDNDTNNIESIYECLPNDINKQFAIILQDGYKLSIIKKFTELCYNKKNIDVFINADSMFYNITANSAEIKFTKVSLR